MYIVNAVTGDVFTVRSKVSDNEYIISYYNSSLLVKLGDEWQLVFYKNSSVR